MGALKNILAAIAVLAIGVLAGWFCRGHLAPDTNVVTRTDTVIIRDTFVHEKPIYMTSRIIDTVRIVYQKDTVTVHDTIVMYREQRFYDHEKYQAWVSGIEPRLDSIRVFPETKYITTETLIRPRPKRWGIGVQAGYGVHIYNGQVHPAPYVGLGVSYNILSW
ncbi:MAG: hypothetical protein NC115_12200 [Bacteroidales bacterium]|nr:hypothetical protein [Bacteroidales bacterium]